ncbi:MAG TPA: hypothetical protein VFE31_09525 [Opitutaceae bacterium]|nr:hypothetical protein [Opitutaceae bacterium]
MPPSAPLRRFTLGLALMVPAAAGFADLMPPTLTAGLDSSANAARSRPAPPAAERLDPLPADAPIVVLVDTIPLGARYVEHTLCTCPMPHLDASQAGAAAENIAELLPEAAAFARTQGANVLVLFGAEHGVPVPLPGVSDPVTLAFDHPGYVLVFFRCDLPCRLPKIPVRFTTDLPPAAFKAQATAVSYRVGRDGGYSRTLASWVYGNLSRFMTQADQLGFDRISIPSAEGPDTEDVLLPGCDRPLRVSRDHPSLNVTIYRNKA